MKKECVKQNSFLYMATPAAAAHPSLITKLAVTYNTCIGPCQKKVQKKKRGDKKEAKKGDAFFS